MAKILKQMVKNWAELDLQMRTVLVMNVGLVGGAFFLGYFYGQVRLLRGDVVANTGSGGGAAVAGATAPGTVAPQEPEAAGPLSEEVWKSLLVAPAAAKGPEDAKVTIVEFTDYQCPFCGRHFEQTDPQIQDNYVKTGKVRYLTRDLPLPFHSNASGAAQAARCAGDQGKYWEMHDKLFENQEAWSSGDPLSAFSGYASEIGIGVGSFESCLSSEKYKEAVDADLALANKVGATGTPTFFVNGKILVGAQPFSAFETLIEKELEI